MQSGVTEAATANRRAQIGSMPAAARLEEESYIDFLEGVYDFARRVVGPAAAARANLLVREKLGNDAAACRIETLRTLLDPDPTIAARNRIYRSTQEMMWRRIVDAYEAERGYWLRTLDAATRVGPGSVELDPTVPLPDYYTGTEFHLQPGSYHGDELAGLWYHYGSKVVFLGKNDRDEIHELAIRMAPLPDDARVERILDLGCSIGQSSTALKQRFGTASVTGIDLAAPMLKYAHERATRLGVDVAFVQRNAEQTGWPDGHFDLVFALLLFHELPATTGRAVIAEARRLLRTGGLFVVVDNASGNATMTPFRRYTSDFSRRFNGEAHGYDFDTTEFARVLAEAHFASVDERTYPADVELPFRMWVCRK